MIVHGFYSYIILLVSLFSIYFSYRLILKSNGNINLPTVGMFFMFNYLIFIYIGSIMMNIYIPETNFIPKNVDILGVNFDRLIDLKIIVPIIIVFILDKYIDREVKI